MQACCGQQRLPPTSKHPVLLWSLWFSSGISLGSACHMTSSGLNLDSNLKFAEVVIVQISAYCFAQSCNHSWSLGKNKEWEQICMFASNSVQSSKSKLATCARKGRLLRFQDLLVVKVLSAPKPLNKLHGVWILFKSVENVKLRTAVSWSQPLFFRLLLITIKLVFSTPSLTAKHKAAGKNTARLSAKAKNDEN